MSVHSWKAFTASHFKSVSMIHTRERSSWCYLLMHRRKSFSSLSKTNGNAWKVMIGRARLPGGCPLIASWCHVKKLRKVWNAPMRSHAARQYTASTSTSGGSEGVWSASPCPKSLVQHFELDLQTLARQNPNNDNNNNNNNNNNKKNKKTMTPSTPLGSFNLKTLLQSTRCWSRTPPLEQHTLKRVLCNRFY